jgi:protein-disulfide isomerase-like protein with CxxC motif
MRQRNLNTRAIKRRHFARERRLRNYADVLASELAACPGLGAKAAGEAMKGKAKVQAAQARARARWAEQVKKQAKA